MRINFSGPLMDASGYAEFGRNFIGALDASGVDVRTETVTFEHQKVDHGKLGKLCAKLSRKSETGLDINVINNLPIFFHKHVKTGCKNVGFTMFETTKIPDKWVKACNQMDAIFVPCQWNKEVFENSGVQVPVYVVRPGMDTSFYRDIDPTPRNKSNEFKFYSIFTWNRRKNYEGLIRAYWSAFAGKEDVSLTLKTYMGTAGDMGKARIVNEIKDMKSKMRVDAGYPKLKLVNRLLSREEILNLHLESDCLVSLHNSEAWGMSPAEAMALGRPVIATNFSGNLEFMNKENSYLVDYGMSPVYGMPWIGFYDGTMWWADADLKDAADKMLQVYENRDEARSTGLKGRQHMLDNFDWKHSAKEFVDACGKVLGG